MPTLVEIPFGSDDTVATVSNSPTGKNPRESGGTPGRAQNSHLVASTIAPSKEFIVLEPMATAITSTATTL